MFDCFTAYKTDWINRNNKKQVIWLFKKGYSEREIAQKAGCARAFVHEQLKAFCAKYRISLE